jgi:hypothetical protein
LQGKGKEGIGVKESIGIKVRKNREGMAKETAGEMKRAVVKMEDSLGKKVGETRRVERVRIRKIERIGWEECWKNVLVNDSKGKGGKN